MNTLQISCFLEAARCRSFSKAARNLYVSQPSFSRNIPQLENELGVTLFRRNSFHGIDLTESGKIMAEAFSHAKTEVDAAAEKARALEHAKNVSLTIGLLEGQLLSTKLEELLADFREEYPNVTVRIMRGTYQKLMAALRKDEVDLVCMPEWQFTDRSQLTLTPLVTLETILVAPKRLVPEVEDREYSLKEFQHFTFISIAEEECRTAQEMLEALCAELGIFPAFMKARTLGEQIQRVEMGEGVILINPYNFICYSPNVTCIKIRELKPQLFAMAWKNEGAPESITLFQSFLQQRGSI